MQETVYNIYKNGKFGMWYVRERGIIVYKSKNLINAFEFITYSKDMEENHE